MQSMIAGRIFLNSDWKSSAIILYRAQKFDIIIEATTGNTSALRRLHSQLL